MALFEEEFKLVTNSDVEAILQEVEELFGDEMKEKKVVKDAFSKIVSLLKNFQKKLNHDNNAYQVALNSAKKAQLSHNQALKQFRTTTAGKNLLDDLEQGYILLQKIREILLSEEINYRFVKEYGNKNRTVRAFSMNLEQLIFLTRKRSFSGYTGNVATLQMSMRGLIRGISDEMKQQLNMEDLTKDPLFNSVMSKWGHTYEHGNLTLKDRDALVEVYYQLKQMGYNNLGGTLLRKSAIYFYKMTSGSVKGYLGNAGQTLSGDAFLLQIKFNAARTKGFNLISFNYLNNGLKSLINTFSNSPNEKELMKNLSKQFIYPDIPEVRKNANEVYKEYANKLGQQIEREKQVLESKIIKLIF